MSIASEASATSTTGPQDERHERTEGKPVGITEHGLVAPASARICTDAGADDIEENHVDGESDDGEEESDGSEEGHKDGSDATVREGADEAEYHGEKGQASGCVRRGFE